MIDMSKAQQRRVRIGDALLRHPDRLNATHADFRSGRAVVFIHGFTADASYMQDLMHQFSGAGFSPFAFEYACHRGIEHSAAGLVHLLKLLDRNQTISKNKVVLVGHSMGGLVARAAVSLAGGQAYVRKVITLGTPHDGTLVGSWLPRMVAYWGEAVGGCHPQGFGQQADSARQLMKADPAPSLLDRLRQTRGPAGVSYFSLSGGHGRLDVGQGYWKNLIYNNYLQRHLSKANDGLVEESSSDLSRPEFAANAAQCTHFNAYVGYPHTNHSYMVNAQEVALWAASCAT
jgi:pimeloyl-ACP methyl ester carboxylesterase